jgi:L-malate glycosyltransferase
MKNKRILVFLPNFSYKNTHGQTFIQTRIDQYLKNNYKIDLISLSKNKVIKKNRNYRIYYFQNYSEIEDFLFSNINNYNKIFIHFITFQIIKILNNFKKLNLFIWIHGIEGQKWTWYKFDLFLKPFWLFKHIIYNIIHLYYLKKFTKKNIKNIKFIFVSKWMKQVFLDDLQLWDLKIKSRVINNPINPGFFDKKIKRNYNFKNNILIIKNFYSKKYAGDTTLKYLKDFSKTDLFSKYRFTIIGDGPILKPYINKFQKFKNIKILQKFYKNDELIKFHQQNWIFFYLTRMDAQSVTLSEAISSGMVCISSNNSAIPEFIKNNKNGYLINNYEEFILCLKKLNNNHNLLKKLSLAAKISSKKLSSHEIYKEEKKFLNL